MAPAVAAPIMTTIVTALPPLPVEVTMFTIARHTNIVIPIILNKIDWLATDTISLAVLVPVFPVTGRHSQINRLRHHAHWHWLDYDRCWVN